MMSLQISPAFPVILAWHFFHFCIHSYTLVAFSCRHGTTHINIGFQHFQAWIALGKDFTLKLLDMLSEDVDLMASGWPLDCELSKTCRS
jgi:hypothetical protein